MYKNPLVRNGKVKVYNYFNKDMKIDLCNEDFDFNIFNVDQLPNNSFRDKILQLRQIIKQLPENCLFYLEKYRFFRCCVFYPLSFETQIGPLFSSSPYVSKSLPSHHLVPAFCRILSKRLNERDDDNWSLIQINRQYYFVNISTLLSIKSMQHYKIPAIRCNFRIEDNQMVLKFHPLLIEYQSLNVKVLSSNEKNVKDYFFHVLPNFSGVKVDSIHLADETRKETLKDYWSIIYGIELPNYDYIISVKFQHSTEKSYLYPECCLSFKPFKEVNELNREVESMLNKKAKKLLIFIKTEFIDKNNSLFLSPMKVELE
ncbi:hypothetical protein SNEBB_000371 [Seison nebaliae]|nr:hypothetical protein SNEBB_000371 [Seison nebaliae]